MLIKLLDEKTLGEVPDLDKLKNLGQVVSYEMTGPGETVGRIQDADVIITNKVVIGKEAIDQAENLKLICIAATGMNNVDLEAAKERGIEVKNVSGYSTYSVADHTFALIFGLLHHIRYYDSFVKSPEGYSAGNIFTHLSRSFAQLNNQTLGIIGLGAIGRKVAEIADCFGSEVIYYSTSGRNSNDSYTRVELEELLKKSDIVSIHAPLNNNTKGLIGKDEFALMKDSAIIINTGRGGIISEKDLAEALDEGLIAGAGIDVFEQEPIPADNPLLHLKYPERLLASPHIAWTSKEARSKLVKGVIDNIKSVMGV